jgi:hypothetical protein
MLHPDGMRIKTENSILKMTLAESHISRKTDPKTIDSGGVEQSTEMHFQFRAMVTRISILVPVCAKGFSWLG